MRKTNPLIAVLMISMLVVSLGCGSQSQQSTEYKTIAGVKLAVDTAMNIWADRVIDGKATPHQEAKVRAAFKSYTDAAGVAANVLRLKGSDAPPPDLTKAYLDLIALLSSFGVNVSGSGSK